MNIKDFPHLSQEEFTEACHHLDSQYCRAKLGTLRRRWKLRICTALDTLGLSDAGYTTYIQIIRPLEVAEQNDDLSFTLDNFSFAEEKLQDSHIAADHNLLILEESDEVWIGCNKFAIYGPSLTCERSMCLASRLIRILAM